MVERNYTTATKLVFIKKRKKLHRPNGHIPLLIATSHKLQDFHYDTIMMSRI